VQRCVGEVLSGEGDVKKGERWFLAVRGWDLESVASMSYFLCISGYFLSIAAWLSGAVSWLGAGNNPLPKNNSA